MKRSEEIEILEEMKNFFKMQQRNFKEIDTTYKEVQGLALEVYLDVSKLKFTRFEKMVTSVIDSEDIRKMGEVLELKGGFQKAFNIARQKIHKYKASNKTVCYLLDIQKAIQSIERTEREYKRLITSTKKENIQQITSTKKEITFYDKIIGTEEEKQRTLSLLNRAINGKKGKDIILILRGAIERGLLTKPTYTQAKKAFNNIGSKSLYNKYLSDFRQLSQLEERNINAIFRNKE